MRECEWCRGEFTPRNARQRYCNHREHRATCVNCPEETTFTGQPPWQRGIKRRGKPWACEACRGEVSKERRRDTSRERHGDAGYNNRDKARATMEERHGGGTTLESPLLRARVESTMTDRYGAPTVRGGMASLKNQGSRRANSRGIPLENSMEISRVLSREDTLERWLTENVGVGESITYGAMADILGCSATELSHAFSRRFPELKRRFIKVGESHWEKQVRDELIQLGVGEEEMLLHRRPLEGREIDIWLPGRKLAFEVNDLATHSRHGDDEPRGGKYGGRVKHGPTYHGWKVKVAAAMGITLHHVWEDDIARGIYRDELRRIIAENGRAP